MKGIKIFLKKKKTKKRKYSCESYQNLADEENDKKRQYHCERHKNLSEDEKESTAERKRNCYITHEK